MELFDEEGFGPSVSLYVARDDAHAIEIANDTAYGLNAAIHTTSMERALAVARELDTAQVHVNSMTAHDEREFSGYSAPKEGTCDSFVSLSPILISCAMSLWRRSRARHADLNV